MFDHLVIGAGITGACTAWALARTGARVAVLERYPAGHDRGSSHGSSRITRTSYHDPLFSRMMIRAHAEDWPALGADLGIAPILPSPGIFFGPPGPAFERHRHAARASGSPVREVDPREVDGALRLEGCGVLLDPTAGVIAASQVQARLRAWLEARCTVVRCHVRQLDRAAVAVDTDIGRFAADSIAVCAGAWTSDLVPELRPVLTPVRQTVAYVRLPGPSPVWVWLDEPSWYGLPDLERGCWKLARHRTSGTADDPDGAPGPPDVDEILAFAACHFRGTPELVAIERCLYTNTPNEDFVLDTLPDQPRIAVGSACSGHGFKFGPLSGRILASLLGVGDPIPEHATARSRFAVSSAGRGDVVAAGVRRSAC